jgi:hypothetical protein
MESPLPTFIAYSVAYYSDQYLVDWAPQHAKDNPFLLDNEFFIQLVSINRKLPREVELAGDYLENFINDSWPDYDLGNPKAEGYAKRYFAKRLKQYLDEKCSPYEVCKMISPIEQIYDFPKWLGGMYDACDWVEPKHKHVDVRHLVKTVEETLNAL